MLGIFRITIAAAVAAAGLAGATPVRAAFSSSCIQAGRPAAPSPGLDPSALMSALRRGREADVLEALASGARAPPQARLPSRQSAMLKRETASLGLFAASARGDLPEMRRLIARGARPNAVLGLEDFLSPLAWAARCDHPRAIALLVDHGAQVDARVGYPRLSSDGVVGSTALIEASAAGARHAVAALLARGADPNIRSRISSADPDVPSSPWVDALEAARDPQIRAMLRRAGAHGRRHRTATAG